MIEGFIPIYKAFYVLESTSGAVDNQFTIEIICFH